MRYGECLRSTCCLQRIGLKVQSYGISVDLFATVASFPNPNG
ncbi:hypothetical protein Hanom_Chr09g00792411 [Helianthus anomalus]